MSIKTFFKSTVIIFLLVLFIASCNQDAGVFTVDYSDVPDLPDTTSAVSKVTSDTGLIYYVIEEGNSDSFSLVIRDDAYFFYTGRLDGENIFESSYANGSTASQRFSAIGSLSSSKGDGFVEGVLGMKEGERRVLVLPPSLNVTSSSTIVYDVQLESIDY